MHPYSSRKSYKGFKENFLRKANPGPAWKILHNLSDRLTPFGTSTKAKLRASLNISVP